jgi:hypothetical protein
MPLEIIKTIICYNNIIEFGKLYTLYQKCHSAYEFSSPSQQQKNVIIQFKNDKKPKSP